MSKGRDTDRRTTDEVPEHVSHQNSKSNEISEIKELIVLEVTMDEMSAQIIEKKLDAHAAGRLEDTLTDPRDPPSCEHLAKFLWKEGQINQN